MAIPAVPNSMLCGVAGVMAAHHPYLCKHVCDYNTVVCCRSSLTVAADQYAINVAGSAVTAAFGEPLEVCGEWLYFLVYLQIWSTHRFWMHVGLFVCSWSQFTCGTFVTHLWAWLSICKFVILAELHQSWSLIFSRTDRRVTFCFPLPVWCSSLCYASSVPRLYFMAFCFLLLTT